MKRSFAKILRFHRKKNKKQPTNKQNQNKQTTVAYNR